MSPDLFDSGASGRIPKPQADKRSVSSTVKPLTVTGINQLAKGLLENSYPPLWVTGEVTGWKAAATGHCYFTLRDRTAQIRCVMFQRDASRLPMMPEEGLQVRALGSLTLYEKRGDFQFLVRSLEGEGAGGLWRVAFEKTKAKLEAEGLLDPARKRRIPRFPSVVGVVTSPVGAALHDILTVVRRRAPWTRIIFSPARVQGVGANQEIARAIRLFAKANVADVLIVGRGGGSTEDLWSFNEELVARAIADSPIPVVSAVGHEVDITIADLVADARAATPSAAAELVVPDRLAISRELDAWRGRMANGLKRRVSLRGRDLVRQDARLRRSIDVRLKESRQHIAAVASQLDALSPLASLKRGYAVPLRDSRVLRSAAEFANGSQFTLRVRDGAIPCRVDGEPAVMSETIEQNADD